MTEMECVCGHHMAGHNFIGFGSCLVKDCPCDGYEEMENDE